MWDRYDPRSDDGRDRGGSWDRSLGSRGGTSERDRNEERDPRDVFTRDLDLPRGRERRPVRERDRVYEIDGTESRMLATIGAFRVVSESDLHDLRDDSSNPRRSARHLENEGLIRTQSAQLGRPRRRPDRARARPPRGQPIRTPRPQPRAPPDLLRRPQEAARADARHQGLSRLPARRGATAGPGRPGSARRPRLRAQARLSALPARAQSRQEGLRRPAGP